jgi:hypothetical protein
MSNDGAYRDSLAAAHARIEELERALGDRRRTDADAARLAALERERERLAVVAAGAGTSSVPSALAKFAVVGAITALAAGVFGAAAGAVVVVALSAFIMAGWSAMAHASRREAVEHLKAFDAKIAKVTRELGDGQGRGD